MSVVNQMLLDLDRRRASATERGSLPQQLLMLPAPMRSLPMRVLMLSAAVLASFLALGGGYAWEQSRRSEPSSVAVPIALPTLDGTTTVEALASPPKSSAAEASPARPQPPRPSAQTTVAGEGKSPPDGAPRDSIRAANTVQARSVPLPPEVSREPRPKPATTSPMAAMARKAPSDAAPPASSKA